MSIQSFNQAWQNTAGLQAQRQLGAGLSNTATSPEIDNFLRTQLQNSQQQLQSNPSFQAIQSRYSSLQALPAGSPQALQAQSEKSQIQTQAQQLQNSVLLDNVLQSNDPNTSQIKSLFVSLTNLDPDAQQSQSIIGQIKSLAVATPDKQPLVLKLLHYMRGQTLDTVVQSLRTTAQSLAPNSPDVFAITHRINAVQDLQQASANNATLLKLFAPSHPATNTILNTLTTMDAVDLSDPRYTQGRDQLQQIGQQYPELRENLQQALNLSTHNALLKVMGSLEAVLAKVAPGSPEAQQATARIQEVQAMQARIGQ